MLVHMHKGQKAVEPQFVIEIEDDPEIGNHAAVPGKERSVAPHVLPLDMPVDYIYF